MHNLDLILTLTGSLAAALILGYVTQRLRLSPIVGYLLAGLAVGPSTPGFVANQQLAEQLAEVGVILLMFGVGLHFHIKELLEVRRVAVPGAVCQSLTATALGCLVAHEWGWSWSAGIVFGLSISVASTVVLIRVLSDNRDLHTRAGHIAVGWLVVEDLFTVLVLVLMPEIFGADKGESSSILPAMGLSVLKLGLLVLFISFIGNRLILWCLRKVAATRSRELFTLSVLVVALGIAVGSAKLFGASMALGAFLAGMVVGRSDFSLRAASEALPMRDAFAVLFFVSVGMLFDPKYLWEAPGLIAATLGIILLGKPLAALVIVILFRYPLRIALAVAIALAQIGEFSFILATLGRQLGILAAEASNVLVAAAIVSISLNPLLYRSIHWLEAGARRLPRLSRLPGRRVRTVSSSDATMDMGAGASYEHRAIVVGYGPVGQTVARLLRESEIEPVVIELNLDTVQRLRTEGTLVVYGDATHRDILKEAGAERAIALILSAAGMHRSEEVIRLARELNPRIRVFARTEYVRELPSLRKAGADAVFSGEGEVALAITEFILAELGATSEQIDRERERVRSELFECHRCR
jgi:CPA2 family monovalent cation:H+ antiporter-2